MGFQTIREFLLVKHPQKNPKKQLLKMTGDFLLVVKDVEKQFI